MIKKVIWYSGVTKRWRKKMRSHYSASKKLIKEYGIEKTEVVLVIKGYNHSRCTDFKQLLKVQALVRLLPG